MIINQPLGTYLSQDDLNSSNKVYFPWCSVVKDLSSKPDNAYNSNQRSNETFKTGFIMTFSFALLVDHERVYINKNRLPKGS